MSAEIHTVGVITNAEAWGLIPTFYNPDDGRPIAEQFDSHYISGFHTREGTDYEVVLSDYPFDSRLICHHAGDEEFQEVGRLICGRDLAILFDYGMVAARTDNGEWTVGRMD